MANDNIRYRIRQAHGGDERVIPDGALPYFPGYVVVEIIGPPPAAPLPGFAVVHGDNANAIRPNTVQPIIWYGTVEPVNSDDDRNDVWVPLNGSGEEIERGLSAAEIVADPTIRAASVAAVQSAINDGTITVGAAVTLTDNADGTVTLAVA